MNTISFPLIWNWMQRWQKLGKSASFKRKVLRDRGSFAAKSPNWEEQTSLQLQTFTAWIRYVQYCVSTDHTCDHLSCAPVIACSLPALPTANRHHAHKSKEHVMNVPGCVFKKNSTSNKLKRCNRCESYESSSWKPCGSLNCDPLRSQEIYAGLFSYGLHRPPEKENYS